MLKTPSKSFNREFSRRLHQALDHKGYDRFKRTRLIADKLKLTTSPVSKWLNGHTIPLPNRMEELCDAFEINSSFLIDGSGPIDKGINTHINQDLFIACLEKIFESKINFNSKQVAVLTAELYERSMQKGSFDYSSLNRLIKLMNTHET